MFEEDREIRELSEFGKPVQSPAARPADEAVLFGIDQIEQSIPDRFEKIARLYPHRIAVKTEEAAVTYAELNAMSNRVARSILAERPGDPEPVGLFFKNGIAQIVCMLGVLKAGKFFVLLDPSFPKDRIAIILEDSQATLMLTDQRNIAVARQAADPGCRIVEFESIGDRVAGQDLGLRISPKALAHIIYTSGSTGRHKGVVQNHVNQLHFVMRTTNADRVSARDSIALLSSGTANTVTNALIALLNGAELLPFDVKEKGTSDLANWLLKERISVCPIAAPLFRKLCEDLTGEERFLDLRFLRLSSDTVYKTDVELYKKYFPSTCILGTGLASSETGPIRKYLINHNTEITGDEVPVGYALERVEIALLDDEGNPVGQGQVGEIAVRGRYLSSGYWRRPELTRTKFVADPSGVGKTIYLTGDLGLMLPDGCLIHKGRKDFRIKIRGFGVDLIEVEKTLLSCEWVKEVVVVPGSTSNGTRLVAYYTARKEPSPTVSELRQELRNKLADYMIPSVFVRLEEMPLTPNGKIDRWALPEPDHKRPDVGRAYIEARNEIEKRLVRIWEEVLDVRPIGIDDNFFDLGGDSLAASRVISRVIHTSGLELPVRALFDAPTVAEMAAIIEQYQAKGVSEAALSRMLSEIEAMTEDEAQRRVDEIRSTIADK